jgi:hypothetical protein
MPPDAGDANLSLPPDQARPPAAAPPAPGEEGTLKATQILHERGRSLWLDNITRGLLDSGQIQHSIDNYAVTGLTSSGRPPGAARAPAGPVLRRGPGAATAQPDPAAPAARRGSDLHLLARRPGGGDVATEIPVSVDFRTALGAAEQPYERILADALAGDPPPLPTRRKRLARDLMAGNGGWHGPGPARP